MQIKAWGKKNTSLSSFLKDWKSLHLKLRVIFDIYLGTWKRKKKTKQNPPKTNPKAELWYGSIVLL